MATQPQLVIEISPAGSVTIDAQCFVGANCAKATEQIEIALGGTGKKKTTKKPEFFRNAGGKQTTKMTF
jgi:hypothetical protein